jgi:mannan endo-1,4-beta-mannosidase
MKKLLYLFMAVLTISFVASCKDDATVDNNTGDVDAPKIVSVTPAPDTTDIDTIDSVVITYNEPIFRTPQTTIKVNDSYYVDSGVVARGNQLIIPLNAQGNQTYTISIKKPSVRDSSYNFASDYSFTFSVAPVNNFNASQFNITDSLCNPNATEAAKKLYQYLKSQFGNHVLSGAIADVNWNTLEADTMYQMSGKYPAINCFDFIHFIYSAPLNPSTWIDYTNITPVKNWFDNGGIVSCMWHWNVPDKQADENDYTKYTCRVNDDTQLCTDFNALKAAVTKSSYEYTHATRDLEIIANYLLSLQAEGIPVIWRPLHEASGNINTYTDGKAWFWWGNHGASGFKYLWKRMFNYFKDKGVNNLIWVWTSEGNDAEWYPGDEYVDIIARDYYENTPSLYHSSIKRSLML